MHFQATAEFVIIKTPLTYISDSFILLTFRQKIKSFIVLWQEEPKAGLNPSFGLKKKKKRSGTVNLIKAL